MAAQVRGTGRTIHQRRQVQNYGATSFKFLSVYSEANSYKINPNN
jgi:hypothetical protein